MKQAIEEGFILDVLKNHMTYKMYYKIVKAIPDNPEIDTTAGAKAMVVTPSRPHAVRYLREFQRQIREKGYETLSRLNRICRGKQDAFVLDFVNSAEDIRKSFEPYYEETTLEEETDPNVIYDLKNTLDEYCVYQDMEIKQFADIFFSKEQYLIRTFPIWRQAAMNRMRSFSCVCLMSRT